MNKGMEIEINKLHNEGKSLREIAELLQVSHMTVKRVLQKDVTVADVTTDVTVNNCPFGKDKTTCELFKEFNNLGKHKLRACDYSKNELIEIDAPYFDCKPI